MARKDALLRLTSRLIARRDALLGLTATWTASRRFSELNAVGDNVDAAVDSANGICSQLVEIEKVESWDRLRHALQPSGPGFMGGASFALPRSPKPG